MTHDTPSDGREHGPEHGPDPADRGGDHDRGTVALLESALASATVRRERRSRSDERG